MLHKILIFVCLIHTCLAISHYDSATNEFMQIMDRQPPYYKLLVDEFRPLVNNVPHTYKNQLNAYIYDLTIPLNNDTTMLIRIIQPPGASDMLPVVFYFHGGGWMVGNQFTHDNIMRKIAIHVNVCVIYLDYPLAPKYKYPIAIDHSKLAIQYIINNAPFFNIDSNKIAIVGDSAGGNLAIIVTQQLEIPISYIVLLFPVTDNSMTTNSYVEHEHNSYLPRKAMEMFYNSYVDRYYSYDQIILFTILYEQLYLDVIESLSSRIQNQKIISPINYTNEQLSHFPPTLIITSENDVLRDEGEQFAHNLMKSEIDVVCVRFIGTIHDFINIDHFADTSATQISFDMIIGGLKRALCVV